MDLSAGSQGQGSAAGSTAAGTPTQPSGNQQHQHGQSQHPGSSGGGDAAAMFAAMRAEIDELKKGHGQSSREAREARQALDRIRKAASGEDDGEGEENENQAPAWFDGVLTEILEAERRGVKLPISSQLAVELHKTQSELAQAIKALKQVQGKADQLGDPETTVNNRAYDQMDEYVGETLENVFGGDYPPSVGKAVTGDVIRFLKELQQEAPQKWHEIRRNRTAQRKIVQHFVNEHIPMHLRKLHSQVREANEPFSHGDAREALREAMALKPEDRAKVMPIVRQRFWETMMQDMGRRRG